MSWEKTERRQPGPSRIPAQLRIELLEDPVREAFTINISHNGLLVRMPHDREIDSFVRLRLYFRPNQEPIEILGRIASKVHAHGKEAMGIHFIDFPSLEKERWLAYIARMEAVAAEQGENTSPEGMIERRTSIRSPSALMVRFRGSERLEEFITKNVSAGGLFLATTHARAIGEQLRVVIIHPVTDQTYEFHAEVVRVDGAESPTDLMGIALRFIDVSEERLELLQQFLASSGS
ncbi:MAG: PilZ domain-containing protein [Pseudomonadota bacterium]